MSYPLCEKHNLLRKSKNSGKLIVSTTALHEFLGEKKYQQAVKVFDYGLGNYPKPESIETFLRKNKCQATTE